MSIEFDKRLGGGSGIVKEKISHVLLETAGVGFAVLVPFLTGLYFLDRPTFDILLGRNKIRVEQADVYKGRDGTYISAEFLGKSYLCPPINRAVPNERERYPNIITDQRLFINHALSRGIIDLAQENITNIKKMKPDTQIHITNGRPRHFGEKIKQYYFCEPGTLDNILRTSKPIIPYNHKN